MRKSICMFLLLFGLTSHIMAQQTNIPDIIETVNKVNADGKKEGLWIERVDRYLRCYQYKNGVRHGAFCIFDMYRNEVFGTGEYMNGIYSGTWMFFLDGNLSDICRDFKKFDTPIPIPAVHLAIGNCEYQCYSIGYHPNGTKSDEGLYIFNEGELLSDPYQYGVWKFYDESGKLIQTKNYE